MADETRTHLDLARQYLVLLEQNEPSSDLARLFAPGFTHHEFPNLLNPRGRTLNRAQLLETALRAKALVADERFEVQNAVASGDHVALEVDWRATLKARFGKVEPGTPMHASFAMFLTFEDRQIASQRNYDCFEPF